ncbi:hypothetical protein EYB45_10260 [Erythrobacteraceae bacterium CFH 75059]|uniref:hypothetical protein n=1 Tax=Qipengyuania thermophila TaxID=2509361 RepID=UPI00101F8835|nr:hypothetical protein [Qipengyuania thermophila]TCD02054.1 hypothetical protein EYB45_10260 [Erythrobacteraceae bacterium CFH 75059]
MPLRLAVLSAPVLLLAAACNQNAPTNTDLPTQAGATAPAAGVAATPAPVQAVPPGVEPGTATTAAPATAAGGPQGGYTTNEDGTIADAPR